MRYIVISYDKNSVTVQRLLKTTRFVADTEGGMDILCQGSSFGDVVKALEQAFAEEMSEK